MCLKSGILWNLDRKKWNVKTTKKSILYHILFRHEKGRLELLVFSTSIFLSRFHAIPHFRQKQNHFKKNEQKNLFGIILMSFYIKIKLRKI